MCLFCSSGSGQAKPVVPKVAPAPTTGSVVDTKPPAAVNDNSAVETARQALAKRQGIFGNIRTSPTGDSAYGTSSLSGGFATFGGRRA